MEVSRDDVILDEVHLRSSIFFGFMSARSSVQNLGRPYWLTLSPMYLWMLVFFTRPHKEERFLFPIYPLICLCGAVALSSLQVCEKNHHFQAWLEFIRV